MISNLPSQIIALSLALLILEVYCPLIKNCISRPVIYLMYYGEFFIFFSVVWKDILSIKQNAIEMQSL